MIFSLYFKKIPICDKLFSGDQPCHCWVKTNISEISVSVIRISVILTLMVDMEKIPEIFVLNSTLAWLITWEDFNTFIHCESLKILQKIPVFNYQCAGCAFSSLQLRAVYITELILVQWCGKIFISVFQQESSNHLGHINQLILCKKSVAEVQGVMAVWKPNKDRSEMRG